jgi:hypothetical protein
LVIKGGSYFDRLGEQGANTAIRWSAINPKRIEAQTDFDRVGLRLADAVANSFYRAVAENDCGNALSLRPITYRSKKRICLGHGLKFFPSVPTDSLLMLRWEGK